MNDGTGGFQASARMAEPAELVGKWEVTGPKLRCRIDFLDTRVESANAWRLSDHGNCLARVAPDAIGWRPAPDGIELASSEGRTVVMFDAAGDGHSVVGGQLRLMRAAG